MDRTATFYSSPSYRYGGGAMPVFSGSRRQRGGSIFGALKNFIMPIASALGRKIVKRGANEAIGLAGDVVKDAFLFRNVNDSLVNNAKRRALDLGKFAADEGLDTLQNMIGSGKSRRRRRRRPRQKSRRPYSRKRKASKKSGPKKKKRRRATVKSLF